VELLGAGATFPYPLYSKMFDVYSRLTDVKVNFQSIGSGGGIRQLMSRTVDFGATDVYMEDASLAASRDTVVQIPTCIGAVVVTYNLAGSPGLRLTGGVLADILLGRLTQWDDPAIRELNPGVTLPASHIVVVHRSDGSGTTAVLADYLAKVSAEWKAEIGVGKSVAWPVGLGAKGNEGVAGLVKQTRGSIGYCELTYAMHSSMPAARIRNRSGAYVLPTTGTISAAAEGRGTDDMRITLTDTDAPDGYPISSFTWIAIYKQQEYGGRSREKAEQLVKLLAWMVGEGQQFAQPLNYAPLSPRTAQRAVEALRGVTFGRELLLRP